MPAFTFAIPVKPRAVSFDWNRVIGNLRATLDSVLASRNPDFRVLLAAHDDLDVQADDRVAVLPVDFAHVAEPQAGFSDKQAKLRFIGSVLHAEGYEGYVMYLDADDLVSRRLVGYVLEDDNRHGYLLRQGYRLDILSQNLTHQRVDFDKSCGSCFVGWFTNADFPEDYHDRTAYFCQFLRHTECFEVASRHGRPPVDVPFPAAVYVTNHADSLRMLKIGGRLRPVSDRDALTDGARILATEFGFRGGRTEVASSATPIRHPAQDTSADKRAKETVVQRTVKAMPPWRLTKTGQPFAPLGPPAPATGGSFLDFNDLHTVVHEQIKTGDVSGAHATVVKHLQHPESMGTAWALLATLVLKTSDDFELAAGYFARGAQLGGWRRSHHNPAASIMTAAAFRSIGALGSTIRSNDIEFGTPPQHCETVLVAAADAAYLDAFAVPYVKSARHFCDSTIGIHLHVFDASPDYWERMLRRTSDPADPLCNVSLSREDTGRGERGYYYVGRFIQIDKIMSYHQATCIVTDIDCIFVDDLSAVLRSCANSDIGLCYMDRYFYFWQNFRANMLVVRDTDGARRAIASLRVFLGSLPRETARYYYVDQAALMMIYYAQSDSQYTTAFITKAYQKSCFQPSGSGGDLQHKVARIQDTLSSKGLDL